MAPNTNTATRILTLLRSAPRPMTVKQLAALTRRHPLSVQRVVKPLRQTGILRVAGKRHTGLRGQPALRYAAVC